ncbi:GDSL-type esterase/lipase family protein [Streptomyces sp. NPDC102384]|uniref:GDSL-type esterase/lipase family protein n=1 Tax=Streptomyces sp. NPDC102384 TaxID=3366166 RepID=UPI00381A2DF4
MTDTRGVPALFVAGDSVTQQRAKDSDPLSGWPQHLPRFVVPEPPLFNFAQEGHNSSTFLRHRAATLVNLMRSGDLCLIALGNTDQQLGRDNWYVPPRVYRDNLRRFAAAVAERGGVPVVVTQLCPADFTEDGTVADTAGGYSEHARAAAVESGVPLLDLHRLTTQLWQELGPEETRRHFRWYDAGGHPDFPAGRIDALHLNRAGAWRVAQRVAAELVRLEVLSEHALRAVSPEAPELPDHPGRTAETFPLHSDRTGTAPGRIKIRGPRAGRRIAPAQKFTGVADRTLTRIGFYLDGSRIGATLIGPKGEWTWRRTTHWPPGEHVLTLVGQLADGVLTAPVDHPVHVVDALEAPRVTMPRPGRLSGGHPCIRGRAPHASAVVLFDGERRIGRAPVRADGSWSFLGEEPWHAGEHHLSVVAVFGPLVSPAAAHTVSVHDLGRSQPSPWPQPV